MSVGWRIIQYNLFPPFHSIFLPPLFGSESGCVVVCCTERSCGRGSGSMKVYCLLCLIVFDKFRVRQAGREREIEWGWIERNV